MRMIEKREHRVEKWKIYCDIFDIFFSKNVTFTKFLSKKCDMTINFRNFHTVEKWLNFSWNCYQNIVTLTCKDYWIPYFFSRKVDFTDFTYFLIKGVRAQCGNGEILTSLFLIRNPWNCLSGVFFCDTVIWFHEILFKLNCI